MVHIYSVKRLATWITERNLRAVLKFYGSGHSFHTSEYDPFIWGRSRSRVLVRRGVLRAASFRERLSWRQPGGKWMVSCVNSHTNATSKRWHLWAI